MLSYMIILVHAIVFFVVKGIPYDSRRSFCEHPSRDGDVFKVVLAFFLLLDLPISFIKLSDGITLASYFNDLVGIQH